MLRNILMKSVTFIASLLGISTAAQAAVPTGVEAVFTTAATDFTTIVGYGWTLFLVIVGGLILFGIVKKVVSRAAGR